LDKYIDDWIDYLNYVEKFIAEDYVFINKMNIFG